MTQRVQTRLNVFETNSSSSHSMTLAPDKVVPLPFPKEILRAGVFILEKGEFGWEFYRHYDLPGKLQYLFTQLFSEDIPQGKPADVLANLRHSEEMFDMLCKVVEVETGCKIEVKPGSYGYIDHDSEGVGLDVFKSEAKLHQLLFNANSYIETSNDNSPVPFKIHTSKGLEYYHPVASPSDEAGSNTRVTLQLGPGGAIDWRVREYKLYQGMVPAGIIESVKWECRGQFNWYEHTNVRDSLARKLQTEHTGLKFSKSFRATNSHVKTEDFTVETGQLVLRLPVALAARVQKIEAEAVVARKRAAAKKPAAKRKPSVTKATK